MIKTAFAQSLLKVSSSEIVAKRTALVLKRKFPIRLHKKDQPPKIFRSKDFVYELVKDETREKKPNIDVILTSYVAGLGQPGDKVSIRPFAGYDKLLLPKLAVYATPENIEKYAHLAGKSGTTIYSSKHSFKTLKQLQYKVISLFMNDTHPWKVEPWHLRAAFRLNGVIVPETSITMPSKEISGPFKDQHRKEFYVTVTISETEQTKVRCRLYLIGINTDPVPESDWIEPADPLFEDDAQVLNEMPKPADLPYIDKLRIMYHR